LKYFPTDYEPYKKSTSKLDKLTQSISCTDQSISNTDLVQNMNTNKTNYQALVDSPKNINNSVVNGNPLVFKIFEAYKKLLSGITEVDFISIWVKAVGQNGGDEDKVIIQLAYIYTSLKEQKGKPVKHYNWLKNAVENKFKPFNKKIVFDKKSAYSLFNIQSTNPLPDKPIGEIEI
jgi:hypothetical protein